jgi:vanillate monooxygenase ferredoxin subunit
MSVDDWRTVRVAKKWMAPQRVAMLELSALSGESFSNLSAGAHVQLQLPNGLLRSYSICSLSFERAASPVIQLAVRHDRCSRGGSSYVAEQVRQGDSLRIRGPFQDFARVTEASYSVLLAGGIGIAPLWPMAQELARCGGGFELHYAAKDSDEAALLSELHQSSFRHRCNVYLASQGRRLNLAQVFARAPRGSDIYLCGPHRFMDDAVRQARASHGERVKLHLESFG